jgi:hypothetical protein
VSLHARVLIECTTTPRSQEGLGTITIEGIVKSEATEAVYTVIIQVCRDKFECIKLGREINLKAACSCFGCKRPQCQVRNVMPGSLVVVSRRRLSCASLVVVSRRRLSTLRLVIGSRRHLVVVVVSRRRLSSFA